MKNLKIKYKLIISFFIMFLLIAALGLYSYLAIGTIGNQTHFLFDHPYTVSTAILRVDANVITIRKDIKMIPLVKSKEEIGELINEIDESEVKIFEDFEIINIGFLGDKSKVTESIALIKEWKPIREEIIRLAENKDTLSKRKAYAMTITGKGNEHYAKVHASIDEFVEFAAGKAIMFNQNAQDKEDESVIWLLLVISISLLIAVALSIYITNVIVNSLNKGVEFAKKVAGGDYGAKLDIHQKDEIGVLAVSLTEMVNSFKKGVDYAQKIAKGDLSNSTATDSLQLSKLEKALRTMENKLIDVIGNISDVTQNITIGSKILNDSASDIASGSNEQAASIEEVSASMEQMVANINQNTDNALIGEKISVKAAQGITKSNESFQITLNAMREIAEKIGVIGEIAKKTDILAINAAIEAARAGEHGKGFAVVATEVRKLAENSQVAAKEISTLVSSSVQIAEESGKLLTEITPEIHRTAVLVQEISNAGNEQNSGANQINNAVQELTKVIQQNSSAADELSSSSKQIAEQAIQLKEAVSFFKTNETNEFEIKQKATENLKKTTTGNKNKDKNSSGYELTLKESKFESDDDFERY